MTRISDNTGGAMTLEKALGAFLDSLSGKNRSAATLRAYKADVLQFITFLTDNGPDKNQAAIAP
jgi:site-specific recombinase XerD